MTNAPNDIESKPVLYNSCPDEVSLAHHGSVIQSFSVSFVNIYAVFNAGAFAACAAIIPTTYGQAALKEFPYLGPATFGLFVAGFFFSSILMVIIFQYSLEKYKYYKEKIKTKDANGVSEKIKFHVAGSIILFLVSVFTISGIISTLIILLSVEVK